MRTIKLDCAKCIDLLMYLFYNQLVTGYNVKFSHVLRNVLRLGGHKLKVRYFLQTR